MNRIDRYIAGLFLGYFAGALVVFTVIFMAVDAMSTISTYQNVSGSSLLSYYAYFLPEMIYRMIPVSCLAGTLFTLSTLNRNSELVALFSIGMGLLRIATPIIILVAFISFLNFYMSDQALPRFAKMKNYIFYNEIKKNPSLFSTVKNERIWYRSHDVIFNLKTLNEKTSTAQGLTLYQFNDAWDLVQMMTAKEVDLLGENWLLKDGSVTIFTEESSFPLTSNFKEKKIVMGEDSKDLSSTAHASDMMTLTELSEFIKRNKDAGLDTVRYEVDYHGKYGFALGALVMSLLGIPFSVARARSGGTMISVGICMALVVVYWIFYSSALTLGNYGYLPPILAGWLPNVVIGGFAFFMIGRLKR